MGVIRLAGGATGRILVGIRKADQFLKGIPAIGTLVFVDGHLNNILLECYTGV